MTSCHGIAQRHTFLSSGFLLFPDASNPRAAGLSFPLRSGTVDLSASLLPHSLTTYLPKGLCSPGSVRFDSLLQHLVCWEMLTSGERTLKRTGSRQCPHVGDAAEMEFSVNMETCH